MPSTVISQTRNVNSLFITKFVWSFLPVYLRAFTAQLINFVLLTHLHDFVALLLWIVVPQNFVDVLKNTVFKLAQHPFMLLLLC